MNQLAQLLQAKPSPSNLGTGMAANAAKVIQSRPYQLHVQEARAMGQEPMIPEEFARMQRGM